MKNNFGFIERREQQKIKLSNSFFHHSGFYMYVTLSLDWTFKTNRKVILIEFLALIFEDLCERKSQKQAGYFPETKGREGTRFVR